MESDLALDFLVAGVSFLAGCAVGFLVIYFWIQD